MTKQKNQHDLILGGLYVAGVVMVAYRIARTLDAVLSKAPVEKKEKPFKVDESKGIIVGVRKYINSLSDTNSKKKKDN